MRIGFLGWADHVHTERWASYVARLGNAVTVFSLSGRGTYPPGVRQVVLGSQGIPYRLQHWLLRWFGWRYRLDILHVHWAHFATMALRARWRGPLVVTAWGSDIYQRDRFSDEEWSKLGDALRRAELVTCDSEDLAVRLRGEFSLMASQVVVVQWGVDTEMFRATNQPSQLLEEIGFVGHPIVLSPRAFTPIYNLETIVSAFGRVRAVLPEARLLMKRQSGGSEYASQIEALLDETGLRPFTHIIEELPYERMPEIYRCADVTVSVPHSDALPMSVLEAMAAGSVPVVSDLPSLRECVEDGRNGFLVPATDIDALASRMLTLLRDRTLRGQMAERNRFMVEQRYSQRMWMQRMQEHFSNGLEAAA